MSKRTLALAVLVACATSLGCSDDPASIELQLFYAQDSCGDTPVNNAFFEHAGTVGVHITDAARDNATIGGTCIELEALPFRALNDLPRILNEELVLEPLPLDGIIRVQIDVFDAPVACAPYRPADGTGPVPRYGGVSPEVFLSEDPERIEVTMRCL